MKRRWPKYVYRYLEKKGLPLDIALTFEDVTGVDMFSAIPHRSDEYIDTSVYLGKGIRLPRPICSANMDTITGPQMCIAMARLGGFGVMPQFSSIEKRVKAVGDVKRADNYVVEFPLTIKMTSTIGIARALMIQYKISGLIVTEEDGETVAGVLSKRDVDWAPDETLVRDRMTPLAKLVTANPDVSLEEAKKILYETRVEKLPILNAEKKLFGLITKNDILKRERFKYAFRDHKGRLGVAAA
ncbi:MAG: IMP dehydrogenase, partial [Candidatus Yanofskybacteria bacterium]|nr:IMP dehydrogenase [Candidatus Yanofskybacteria bacterium]